MEKIIYTIMASIWMIGTVEGMQVPKLSSFDAVGTFVGRVQMMPIESVEQKKQGKVLYSKRLKLHLITQR